MSNSTEEFASTPTPDGWPHSVARSSGTSNVTLLTALLATNVFEEISNAEDFVGVERYIFNRGRSRKGRLTMGVIFWLYPTGLYGPYHVDDEGTIHQHGVLITIEDGVEYAEAVRISKEAFRLSGIAHEHIAAGRKEAEV